MADAAPADLLDPGTIACEFDTLSAEKAARETAEGLVADRADREEKKLRRRLHEWGAEHYGSADAFYRTLADAAGCSQAHAYNSLREGKSARVLEVAVGLARTAAGDSAAGGPLS